MAAPTAWQAVWAEPAGQMPVVRGCLLLQSRARHDDALSGARRIMPCVPLRFGSPCCRLQLSLYLNALSEAYLLTRVRAAADGHQSACKSVGLLLPAPCQRQVPPCRSAGEEQQETAHQGRPEGGSLGADDECCKRHSAALSWLCFETVRPAGSSDCCSLCSRDYPSRGY